MKRILTKIGVLVLFTFLGCFSAKAQEISTRPQDQFSDKVRFGGGLGLSFGNNNTLITVAPSALYQPNQYIAFGPGLNFTYQQSQFFRSTLYGGSAIVLVNPIRFIQLSSELEQLRVNQTIETVDGDVDDNFWNTSLFLGAGFRTGNVTIGVRYNVLFEDGQRIYADAWQPFVRIYF